MADEHHHHDPTFYRTPRDAAEAPPEKLAYVATFSRPAGKPDARSPRTPRDAAEAPPEKLAYVATFSRPAGKPDAIAVVDVDPDSDQYGSVVGFTELPHLGAEVHHFGSNARYRA